MDTLSSLDILLAKNADIKELCEKIIVANGEKDKRIENLEKEIANLVSGVWKEERCKKLKEEYEKMQQDYFRGFPISEEEAKEIQKFKDKYKKQYFGAIGGAFTYQFNPTSIGVSGKIIGPDGEEFEFCKIG